MISEETALELLEQLLILNRNLEEFNQKFHQKRPTIPHPHPGDCKEDWVDYDEASEKKTKPKEPRPPPERKKLFDFEPVATTGPTIVVTDDKGKEKEQPAYFYIGQKQFDPNNPIPECFPAFGTEDCKEPETCAFRKECEEHPENEDLQEPKGGFTPRAEKTIIQPAVFDDSDLAEANHQESDNANEEESEPDVTDEDTETEIDIPPTEQEREDEEAHPTEEIDSAAEEPQKEDSDENKAPKISKKLEGYLELGKHIKELQNAEVIEDKSE